MATNTAYHAFAGLGLKAKETLVVDGAAGGVGSVAVQIAKHLGATVIGTASEGNHEYLRSLGVEPVTYGEGLAERIRALAPDGVDAALDTRRAGFAARVDRRGWRAGPCGHHRRPRRGRIRRAARVRGHRRASRAACQGGGAGRRRTADAGCGAHVPAVRGRPRRTGKAGAATSAFLIGSQPVCHRAQDGGYMCARGSGVGVGACDHRSFTEGAEQHAGKQIDRAVDELAVGFDVLQRLFERG